MKLITDVTPKTGLTVGVVFTLVVNFAASFAARNLKLADLCCTIEVAYIESHPFDVGSFGGGVQWAMVDGMLLPITQAG